MNPRMIRTLKAGMFSALSAVGGLYGLQANAGAPSLGNIISIPEINVILYQDSDNGTPAAAGSLFAYYVPVESRISRRADHTAMFAFQFLDNGDSEATFSLTLTAQEALTANLAQVKARVASQYGATPDRVQIMPLPLLSTSIKMFHTGDDFTEVFLPLDNTPSTASLSFDLKMTSAGTSWFRSHVIGHGGLQFAAMQGYTQLYDPFSHGLQKQAFRLPIYLHDVPFCAVVNEPCDF